METVNTKNEVDADVGGKSIFSGTDTEYNTQNTFTASMIETIENHTHTQIILKRYCY